MKPLCFPLFMIIGAPLFAVEYMVAPLKEAPPADEIAAGIAEQLSNTGFTVKPSETSTLCNIWFCKEWKVAGDFEPTDELLFPFTPGQLIGVIQYKRRGGDFRDQDINRGVYTLRFAQQPTDGNHEGTSATRDFLLVVSAEKDKSPDAMDVRKLYTASAEAAESSHPGLLLLQKVPADADVSSPSIRTTDDDWSIVRLWGMAAGEKPKKLAMDLVVVGHADE